MTGRFSLPLVPILVGILSITTWVLVDSLAVGPLETGGLPAGVIGYGTRGAVEERDGAVGAGRVVESGPEGGTERAARGVEEAGSAVDQPDVEADAEAWAVRLADPDASVRRLALTRLRELETPGAALPLPVALDLLADPDVEVRRNLIDWLVSPAGAAIVDRARLLVLAIGGEYGSDVTVRTRAAAALAVFGSDEPIPYLIDSLENDDLYVRLYAIQILESLTGETRGFQPHSPRRARLTKVRDWRRWWAIRTAK